MARERARPESDEEHPRRPAKRSPGFFGLALVLFVLALVMLLYTMTTKRVVQEPPRVEEQKDPFADLPPEPPPEKQAKTKGQLQKEQGK